MTDVRAASRMQAYVDAAVAALEGRRGAVLSIELPTAGAAAAAADRWQMHPPIAGPGADPLTAAVRTAWARSEPCLADAGGGRTHFVEPLLPPPRMVVAGGGHIGRALATLGAWIGWEAVVVDSRQAFADPAGLPETTKMHCGDYAAVFAELALDPWTYVISVTPGYLEDARVLSALAARPDAATLPYVGVIGSRRRLRAVRDAVAAAGADPAFLAALHAPIGLDLGAESPHELALAIVAELLLVQRGGTGCPVRDLPTGKTPSKNARGVPQVQDLGLWRGLAGALARAEAVALACVVAAKGSTPRRPGARMLVFGDGRTQGSTGGGVGEGLVRSEALAALRSGQPRLVRVDLTQDVGSGQAGICGGYQEVLVEPLTAV